jgi:predicted RNase H-like HicB family nuclease
MVFEGSVYKSGKFWISEAPVLDAMTQGHSKADAIEMLKDWIRSILDRPHYKIEIEDKGQNLIISLPTSPEVISLVLVRMRERMGLTVREAAKLLGFKSHNAYAQYERGIIEPKLSQLERFLQELQGETELKIKIG